MKLIIFTESLEMSYKLKHQPCSVYQYADEQIEFWPPEMASSNYKIV